MLLLLSGLTLHAQVCDLKLIENGGTGAYKAVIVSDESLPGYTIYRPQNLKAAADAEGPLPVMIWANGGCSSTSLSHELVLNEIASHGYIVVAVGPLRHTSNDNYKPQTTDGKALVTALDWIGSQTRNDSSEYYGMISNTSIAAAGQSCGGAQVLSIANDRRIKTYLMVNAGLGEAGMNNVTQADLRNVKGSIIYIVGGMDDIAYDGAVKDYALLEQSEIASAFTSVDRGHMGTFFDAHGGSFAKIMVDWLNGNLKNDRESLAIFRDGDTSKYPEWTIKSRHINADEYEYPTVHDPAVAYCDGRYYMFTTGMTVLSSSDMKKWRFESPVFKQTPQWAAELGFRGMPWAPDIQYINGQWYIFYSYSEFGKNNSAIGVATNKTLNPESPDFKWEDHGMIVQSVPGRDEWNAIDANVTLDDEGNGWLVFGSFWRGIKITKLDPSMTKLTRPQVWYPVSRRPEGTAPETVSTDTAVTADPRGKDFDAGNGAVEAPFIVKHDGYYYLFVSFDLCCRGEESTYNVVVGRSKEIYGPYLDKDGVNMMDGGGTTVVKGNGQYSGIGHCAVARFDGHDYIFMHGYDKNEDYASKLVIRELTWSADGWPSVRL